MLALGPNLMNLSQVTQLPFVGSVVMQCSYYLQDMDKSQITDPRDGVEPSLELIQFY